MQSPSDVAVRATLFALLCAPQALVGAEPIQAHVAPSKALYIVGEPIGLRVTFTNSGSSPMQVAMGYRSRPFGVTVVADPDNRGKSPFSPPSREPNAMSLRIPYRTVRPGANFSTDVVVQDFSGALPVGNHVVSYSIRIRAHAKDPLDPILIEGDGLLSISIATGSDAEMTGILTNLTSRIGDYWSDREAEQAICATTSPLVLPFLGDVSRFTWSDCEVDALINFRGNKEAEALLETFVLSPRTSMKALGVAKDLRYRLPMSTITQLLNRKWQTLETLYYLGALADPAYLPAITRFLDDPDSVVAGAAARAQTKVLAAKQ